MPSSNGVYTLPTGYLAVTGTTIQASQHNPPLEDIAAALTGRLSRDGTAAMTGSIQFALGTVNAPGAVFSTDLTSGFYKTTSGIGVAIGGVKVGEFAASGLASGVWLPGMLLPYTGATEPSDLWVLPYGQSLNRTGYPDLWAFAQTQIAAGNTLYNNGNGSTTFGLPDLRGRVLATLDNLGGFPANRLTTVGSGALGSAGGTETHALTLGQLPGGITSGATNLITITPSGAIPVTGNIGDTIGSVPAPSSGSLQAPYNASGHSWNGVTSLSSNVSISVASNNTGGAAHPNVQPTLICSHILYAGVPA